MSIKQTFVIVAMSWIVMSVMGSVPLALSGYFNNYADALFESVSGFTTTGATILSEVENLPRSINMLRCLTHWIGGMGIVTLTVAFLPLLGVGGFQLIKAETNTEQIKIGANGNIMAHPLEEEQIEEYERRSCCFYTFCCCLCYSKIRSKDSYKKEEKYVKINLSKG